MLRFKRFTLIMALIALSAFIAAGCGAKNAEENKEPAGTGEKKTEAAAENTDSQDGTGEIRKIKHAMGEQDIQGTPQRVVILTNEGTEALLALGVKPVGAVNSWVGDPWYDHIKDDMKDVIPLGEETQPNIELIASLKPDLIIGNKVRHEKIYEQLKNIAPTVFSEDLAGKWRVNFELYADALNKKSEGEKLLQQFDQRVEEAKTKLGDKTKAKVSVVRFSAKDVRIYQKDTFSGLLLNQLGFARPASQDKDQFMEALGKERIPDMDGDIMFYFVSSTPGNSDADNIAKEWLDDPLFKNLNVSKTNKVVQVNEVIWNIAGGYKAANMLLDDILKQFNA